jgi:F-type H+-transporting ATPase subunit delta
LQYFIDSAKEFKGIGVAYVTTPLPLNDSQKSAITEKLLATTQYKEMEMHYAINKELIGETHWW